MKIHFINPEGIHSAEKEAINAIGDALPDHWLGYAALVMLDRFQGNGEIDLIIVTDVNVLVVELKRVNGKLTSDGEYWYKNGERLYTNPIHVTDLKAKKLKTKISTRIGGKLKKVPYVDFCVVLYGKSTKDGLPEDEKGFVIRLEDFKKIGDWREYRKHFYYQDWMKSLSKDKKHCSYAKVWNQFFGKNKSDFKGKEFSINNYSISGSELFCHPNKSYREFMSVKRDDSNYKALMRRWDFSSSVISGRAQTTDERCLIGFRESRVLGYIDNQDEDLKSMHLGLVHIPSAEDVTSDFVELYEWPRNRLRLDEFINKHKKRLGLKQRTDLIQILVSQIARLHDIDVAHRDIGKHSVWLSLPSRVTLSNFVTATYPDPDGNTVYSLRDVLQASRVEIPEDLFEDKEGTAFTRDVYLAGACAHYIAYDRWPQICDGVYNWVSIEKDQYEGKLNSWFEKMLDLSAGDRFSNMREALIALNEAVEGDKEVDKEHFEILNDYRTDNNVYIEYQPVVVSSKGTAMLMKSADERFGIKLWNGVSPSVDGAPNQKLILFLSRVQGIVNAGLEYLPTIESFGFNPTMQALHVVYKWQDGKIWSEWLQENDDKEQIHRACKELLVGLELLHKNNLCHGDIHPKNIVVYYDGDEINVKYIDLLDYSYDEGSPYTPCYVPDNFKKIDLRSRDRYAVVKVIQEAASGALSIRLNSECNKLLGQPEITEGDICRLLDGFDGILEKKEVDKCVVYDVVSTYFRSVEPCGLASDDGKYFIRVAAGTDRETDKPLLKVFLSGVNQKVDIHVDPDSKKVLRVFFADSVTHSQYIKNKKYCDLELKGSVVVSNGLNNDAEQLVEWLYEQDVVKETLTLLSPELESEYRSKLSVVEATNVSTENVWQALVETEEEVLPSATITRNAEHREDGTTYLYFSTEDGDYDFDLNVDTVFIKKELSSGLRTVGRVKEFGSDIVQVSGIRRKTNFDIGETIRFESSLSAASLAKRQIAIETLVRNRSVINNIPSYFDIAKDVAPMDLALPPSEAELDEYNEYGDDGDIKFELNRKQRDAFKKLYQYGPVSLLQGPPGTGKTAFISSFIHYALTKGAKRILLVSQSHEAVNNAAEKVRGLFQRQAKEIGIVRLGDESHLSESLRDVHEQALQDHYREKFRAEFKNRVTSASIALGLPDTFIDEAIDFEWSFGLSIDSLARIKDLSGSYPKDVLIRDEKLRLKLKQYMERKSWPDFNTASEAITDLRDRYYDHLCEATKVDSPNAVERFIQLVGLSNEWLKVMSSKNANFQNFLAKTRTLVCGTCVGIGRSHYGIGENVYDWVVIDEAARSTSSELAIAMQVGRRILVVGDHQQLPPMYQEEHLKATRRKLPNISLEELSRSDFERGFLSNYGKNVGQTLVKQYRMAPAIGTLVSHCFYEELLENGRDDSIQWVKNLPEDLGTTVTWVDTSSARSSAFEKTPSWKGSSDHSKVNEFEAKVITSLVLRIISSSSFLDEFSEEEVKEPIIGVICMYGEQRKLLLKHFNRTPWGQELLEKRLLKVDTVDSYQGQENQIIIVSIVRNNSHGNVGFLSAGQTSSKQRTNVAISRAQERLYLVGAASMFEGKHSESALGKVLSYIKSNESEEYKRLDHAKLQEGC